jgi:hypothetical protein
MASLMPRRISQVLTGKAEDGELGDDVAERAARSAM